MESTDRSIFRPIILVSFLVVLLGVGGWYIWEKIIIDHSGGENKATSNVEESGKIAENEESADEELLKAQMPSLTRAIPAEADADTVLKINETIQDITKNYDYLQTWLNLGALRKAAGDYGGAIEAWKFATVLRPQNSIAFLNLGDLYGWYLRDNKKAEQYLLAGIAAEPNSVYAYYKTYEFYVDMVQNAAKARKILEDGIAANPTMSQDLKNLLKNL